MTSVASDDKVDTHLQESYLNDRCAYLTEQLAKHNAEIPVRTRSVSVSDYHRRQHRHIPVITRQRHDSAQVNYFLYSRSNKELGKLIFSIHMKLLLRFHKALSYVVTK